jgi:hypothetical protein
MSGSDACVLQAARVQLASHEASLLQSAPISAPLRNLVCIGNDEMPVTTSAGVNVMRVTIRQIVFETGVLALKLPAPRMNTTRSFAPCNKLVLLAAQCMATSCR